MKDLRTYRSHSQVSSYNKCPHRYYKERIEKAWQIPAAWLAHGTAAHKATELWWKSGQTMSVEEAQRIFRDDYLASINQDLEETPNPNYWFSSGRYRGMDDIMRRLEIGQNMVAAYIRWALNHPEEKVWTSPDGDEGIELELDFDFEGVRIRGYVDRFLTDRIRDFKTGAKPDGPDQLQLYREGAIAQFDTDFEFGDYFMGKDERPYPARKPIDLTKLSREELVDKVLTADEGILAERFDPKPSKANCDRCPVKLSCEFSRA